MAATTHTTLTLEQIVTAERVRAMLREIDVEAADARVLASTVTLCVEAYTRHTTPIGENGSEHIVLTDGEREILTHHANNAEISIRRVADAVEEAAATAKRLPPHNVVTFDPIIRDVDRYRHSRELMECPSMSDEDAMILHAQAIAPFSGDKPPAVRSAKGAVEALKLLLFFQDVDPVDRNIVEGVVAFLEGRA